MQPLINISKGNSAFTERVLDKAMLLNVIKVFLNKAAITAAVEIAETSSPDFLTVNGIICRYPHTLVNDVEASLAETDNSNTAFWHQFILQICWLQPQFFYAEDLVEDYFPLIEKRSNEFTAAGELIKELMELKIPLPAKEKISSIGTEFTDLNLLREELIEIYSGKEISVCINPKYFDEIFSKSGGSDLFKMMRDGLFYETGVAYPSFKIVLKEELPLTAFYFEINAYSCLPFKGIAEDFLLVNDTQDRLRLLGIEAQPAINPANNNPAAFITADSKVTAENAGFTTWNAMGYFILCFSSFLRQHGYLCINKKLVLHYFEKMKPFYPALVEVIETDDVSVITKMLRLLAKEKISIRNLKTILEAVTDFDWIKADDYEHIIFDERVPLQTAPAANWKSNAALLTAFVRTKLKRYISHYYSMGQNTLAVYLLDREIERLFLGMDDKQFKLSSTEVAMVLQATDDEFNFLPSSQKAPVVLTTQTVRPHFKRLIETSYPLVTVLAYQELSPEMNIQPVARISLT